MNNNKNGIIALLSLVILGILTLVIFVLVRCSEVINPIPVLTETSTQTTVSTTLETETTNSNTTISTTVLTTTETVSSSSNSTSSESATTTETVILYSAEPVTTKDEIISIPYDIIVITDPPITTMKEVETTIYTTTIPYITTPTVTESPTLPKRTLLKVFPKGTYFCYERTGVKGGSGRTLIDCSIGENNGDKVIKGSIACRYLYDLYCYNRNGRTTVYLEIPEYPQMTGHYYLDDCNGSYDIVDFFYYYASNCPFQYQGVVSNVSVYIDN